MGPPSCPQAQRKPQTAKEQSGMSAMTCDEIPHFRIQLVNVTVVITCGWMDRNPKASSRTKD